MFCIRGAPRAGIASNRVDATVRPDWASQRRPIRGPGGVYTVERAGDHNAFRDLVQGHSHELQVRCYRILGSLQDAEDALQETLVSAWRNLGEFGQRSSLRTWQRSARLRPVPG
ncbi:MAG TPA: sigma factor [Streptosporangiaceae bacterium]